MELSHVSRAIRQYWVLSIVAFLCILGAAAYFAYSPPARYSATATLLVEPADTSVPNSVSTVAFFLPALQVQLQSDALATAAASRVPTTARGATVNISNSVQQGTGILQITAEGTAGDAVAPWANAYAKALVAAHPLRKAIRIRQIDPAGAPSGPSGPGRSTLIISGVVLALIAATVLPLIAESVGRRRRLAAEIARRFELPVLGEIPVANHALRTTDAAELAAAKDRAFVNAVLRARANLESHLPPSGSTLCFVSPGHREGTTTLVGMLAYALARVGHEVVVIDANVRDSSMDRNIVLDDAPVAPTGSVTATSQVSLRVVAPDDLRATAEKMRPSHYNALHPAETLAIALPHSLRASERPGVVTLIDTPPLSSGADAAAPVGVATGVVIVVDFRRPRALARVERAIAQVREAGGMVTGVIINRTKQKRREPAAARVRRSGTASPAHQPRGASGQQPRPANRDVQTRQPESPTEVV